MIYLVGGGGGFESALREDNPQKICNTKNKENNMPYNTGSPNTLQKERKVQFSI